MLREVTIATALATILGAPIAFAQSTGDSQPAPQPAPTTEAPADAASSGGFVERQSINQWRAPRLVGVVVYGSDGKRVGTIRDILMDHDGDAQVVVIAVGGFLGFGAKEVGLPFKALFWHTEPRAVAVNVPQAPTANPLGAAGGAAPGTQTTTTDPAATEANQGYPDQAAVSMTIEQLENAPDFHYAPSPIAMLEDELTSQSPATQSH